MEQRRRAIRILKWTGLVSCAIIAAAWGTSLWWSVSFVSENGDFCFDVSRGQTGIAWGPFATHNCKAGWWAYRFGIGGNPKLHEFLGLEPPRWRRYVLGGWFDIPFWLLFIAAAAPTGFLLYRDR